MYRDSLRYGLGVITLHGLGFFLLILSVPKHPMLLGLALLAYTFGLRHAFDVDHIAFIDNMVRKFLQQGKKPHGIGFFFSMGHSTVVVLISLATAVTVHLVQKLPQFQRIGGIVSTFVSGSFLLVLACINLFIWLKLFQVFLSMRRNRVTEHEMDELLHSRGFFSRLVAPLMKLVTNNWHVYPIGFLFGLGFDTASEVALLAISATASQHALPLTGIISLPIVFAAGMSFMDTADGIFMTTAYGFAFATPLRKIYYNLSVTGLGVLAASVIGVIELVQVVTQEIGLSSGFWGKLQGLNFGVMGYILVALFIGVWGISFGSWKLFRIEERWAARSERM
ncbi:HoxN/HupN/NixA family nickel/cobalt transporter [Ferroacidibacillus organovorans]|uniref:Nickel/cobalt efflux system n=1 Tax=Ferroacidibacillus organovorans TaxID=1765683 RepID=A0A162S2E8_9BACL|nr:HoxN/HupN/NixA family nickel/cobalt transporter [Ferroacidibacillus organovorans]KYP79459.1 nickel permease [Ferroacidibacillus organovorans]OAG94513.1 nickel permease [Ferroacidibacillus organovorans]OPG15482.1 nickel permease [Ferroacidibacillus organovorans]